MPFNGSGTYSAPSSPGAFNPATTGQQATPTAWNALLTDLATALSTTLTRDGQSTVTNDIPMNAHKLTGLANGTAATDAANIGQVANGGFTSVNDTGAADAYVIAPSFPITVYAAYQAFQFKAANANTGTSTLAVSGLAAKTIKHLDGTNLLAGDILAGQIVEVMYDGTNFQLLSATGLRGTANTWRAATTLAATTTLSGAPLNEAKGADIASAATLDLTAATGNVVDVTGTTTVTAITLAEGAERVVRTTGILTWTHGASLVLPTGANITSAAGDYWVFRGYAAGVVRMTGYQLASGRALDASLSSLTNSLGADVALDNISNYFTGPTVAQGTSGTWFASGTVTLSGNGGDIINCKLWDGTTVIASAAVYTNASVNTAVSLSGFLASPAGNLRISCQNISNTTSTAIVFNATGESKDSTLTAIQIA